MLILILVLLGLCAGSFINALVWRLRQQTKPGQKTDPKLSITRGRSICPHCKHELAAKDLIPLLSWLWLRGRCRYCRRKIADNPLVELAMPVVFVLTYIWWPASLSQTGQKILLATWLVCLVGLMALLVYDYKWLLLPNRLIYPTFLLALAGRLAFIVMDRSNLGHDLWLLGLSLVVASGVFWLLFELSRGQWIGFGDVRLGLITGSLLADPRLGLLMIFGASLLGLAVFLAGTFGQPRTLNQKIPFGPFLITAAWLALLAGPGVIAWYSKLLGV